MGWKIFGLLVSVFMIIGGLSGDLVLRGTNSSQALVVAGAVFFLWELYSIITHKKEIRNAELAATERLETAETLAASIIDDPNPVMLDRELSYPLTLMAHGMLQYGHHEIFLNGVKVGEVSGKQQGIVLAHQAREECVVRGVGGRKVEGLSLLQGGRGTGKEIRFHSAGGEAALLQGEKGRCRDHAAAMRKGRSREIPISRCKQCIWKSFATGIVSGEIR
jgi:hypothetical protein